MPALLTKDENLQQELMKVLQAIACMSLGSVSVILTTAENNLRHQIFANDAVKISVICSKCHSDGNEANSEDFLSKVRQKNIEVYADCNIVTSSQHSTMMGLRTLFAKFLNSKHYVNVEKSGFWNLAGTLCHHFFVFDNTSSSLLSVPNCGHILRALKPFLCDELVSLYNHAFGL